MGYTKICKILKTYELINHNKRTMSEILYLIRNCLNFKLYFLNV